MDRSSVTALAASLMRAVHARCDEPKIVDDSYGDAFVTDAERAFIFERLLLMVSPETRAQIEAVEDKRHAFDIAVRANAAYGAILVRTRYAEDQLIAAIDTGVRQYVVVGAGMDSFALRRPDLAHRLEIFEIDYPATQAIKRERLLRAGFALPANLHLVAADVSEESVDEALARSPYLADERAFFSCLGLTVYLSREANLRMLRAIASCAARRSEIVFDYLESEAIASDGASQEVKRIRDERAATAEPWVSGFDPRALADELAAAGFELLEDLAAESAHARYCAGRSDGIRFPEHAHLARARVATGAKSDDAGR